MTGRRLSFWKVTGPRSSILVKVLGGLVAALVLSSASTGMIGAQLTNAASARQARQLTSGQLSTLAEAYSERERQLVVSLRNLSQVLTFAGLTAPSRRHELISELGRTAGNLQLDLLRVLDEEGGDLQPPAGTGYLRPLPESVRQAVDTEPRSRLMPTADGRWVQALATPLPSPEGRLLLVGGYQFDDSFAYRLRSQLGGLADVTLVAGGRVVGTTLSHPPSAPPGLRGARLPESPVVVHLDGVKNLVAYVPVSRTGEGPSTGAIGVTLPDLLLTIDRTVVQARVISMVVLALVALALGWLLFRALVRPMTGLAATARRIAAGDGDASFRTTRGDEVGILAASLEAMRLELGNQLAVIARQAADLQESSERIVAAQDEERHRLARDLHDGIQQQLVVMRMRLGLLEGDRARGGGDGGLVDRLGADLDHTIEQLREVTQDLYPSILLDRGLAPALCSYVGRLPISTRLRCDPEEFPRLAPEIESAAYFLLCEALTNCLKHSGASAIEVSLTLDGAGWLAVCIADDGRGFDVEGGRRGGGLQHMEDRVRSFGGDLTVDSSPGSGTRIRATFPHRTEWERSLWRSGARFGS